MRSGVLAVVVILALALAVDAQYSSYCSTDYTDCGSCVSDAGCFWCEDNGGYCDYNSYVNQGNCYNYDYGNGSCPASGSSAGAIAGSVIGCLCFVFCVVALFQLTPAEAQNPTCAFCQFAVKFIEGYLEENATEAQIIKALDVVCQLGPSTFTQDCMKFVAQEVPVIILYLENKQPPNTICSEIQLCSSRLHKQARFSGQSTCQVCTALVTYGEQLVKSGKAQQQILHDLDQQCDVLGRFWGAGKGLECKAFVAIYLPQIFNDAKKSPTEICKSAGINC